MSETILAELEAGIRSGEVVPYLGPDALAGVVNETSGAPIPASSNELILAMNNGQPMAPKLMYEFPRAAMNVELKRGRSAVTRFLDATYGAAHWSRAALHDWLAAIGPPYVIDINRDTQLLDGYAHRPHLLILGCARMVGNRSGSDYRFKLYVRDGDDYRAIDPTQAPVGLPVLFKPMGAPRPRSSYIASDADYVDYITELMGGFAVPSFVKAMRRGKRYLLLGMRLNRDSERMVFSDLIYDAATGPAGWALIAEPTDKERRFCKRQGIELVDATIGDLLREWSAEALAA